MPQPKINIASLDDAVSTANVTTVSVAGGSNVTLTATQARTGQLVLTGAITANINVIVPTTPRMYVVTNNTTGAFTVTVKTAAGTGVAVAQTASVILVSNGTNVVGLTSATPTLPYELTVAASDEATALTAGTSKITFRAPVGFTLTSVRASLTTAQTSGSIFTVDVNKAGVSVLSTKLTIDNTERTSTTAATPAVISDSTIADDAELSIDIDQIGDGTAKGLRVTLYGTRA